MELWRRNFHDSEEFIQFYFNRKYSDEYSLVLEENGKALSAFLMLPYPMSWGGTMLPTYYISGACTLKEVRNHGLMTMLLKTAFAEMNKHNIALSILIPAEEWLFNYYNSLGYATVFNCSFEHFTPKDDLEPTDIQVEIPETFDPIVASQYFNYFDTKMKERNCCIQHPLDDYLAVVEETYMSGGRLLVTSYSSNLSGWALAVPEENRILVKEMVYNSPADKMALLYYCQKIWPGYDIVCKQLPNTFTDQRLGMARITDAFQMLDRIATDYTDKTLSIKLQDPQLPENSGTYILAGGKCHKFTTNEPVPDIETDIPTLTQALLGYHTDQIPQILSGLFPKQNPYMNLMLD